MLLLDRLTALSTVAIFADLRAEELLRVAQVLEERTFADGAVVFEEGQPGGEMFLVVRGTVRLVKGDAHQVAALGPGDFFGEMALFEAAPRSTGALAQGAVTLLALRRRVLRGLIHEQPSVSFALLRALSHRLRGTTARIG